MEKEPTIRLFEAPADLWQQLDEWSERCNFQLMEETAGQRRLYRYYDVSNAPIFVEVSTQGSRAMLTAWVKIPLFFRIILFGTVPETIGLESGGVAANVPREIGRGALNPLLARLRTQAIR